MAKKKKGNMRTNDSRGYGQSSAAAAAAATVSASSVTAISSEKHDGMKSLLHQMSSTGGEASTRTASSSAARSSLTSAAVASDRFASRLQGVVDRLVDLGFANHHLDAVVPALGYSITLESALDWLCLRVDTMELPALFTDGRLRESLSTITTNDSLTVLKLVKPVTNSATATATATATGETAKQEDAHSSSASTTTTTTPLITNQSTTESSSETLLVDESPPALSTKDREELAERKKWLLQQYQYVYDDDNEDGEEQQVGKTDDIPKPNTITRDPPLPLVVTSKNGTLSKNHDHDHDPEFDSFMTTTTSNSNNDTVAAAAADSVPAVTVTATVTAAVVVPQQLSPDELYLVEQEALLKELEADVNNEANNYMRTKHEIKQLRNDLKQKKQMVQGIRKRIERGKAKQRKKEAEEEQNRPAEVIEDDNDAEDDEGGGFLDLFGGGGGGGGDDEEEGGMDAEEEEVKVDKVATTPAAPAPPPKPLIDAVILKDWTGATPQKTLEEYCRKQKLPRPKFTSLPYKQGYSLVLTMQASKKKKSPPETTIAYNSEFRKGSSLPDYLATQALYRMEPTLPLYRMFPPVFRELWLSWLREVEDAKTQEMQSRDSAKQERLDYLMSLISNQSKQEAMTQGTARMALDEEEPLSAERDKLNSVPDDWDAADAADPRLDQIAQKRSTKHGQKLREEFIRRKSTSDYQKMLQVRDSLPMTSFRQEILDIVEKNPVTILSAQTGAGKTTQCPQYLLEQALLEGRGDSIQILVTQPRRVAATSVAERVSEEMCEPRLGRWIGYQIRMEAKRSAATKLMFCTTGIILRRLQEDRNLEGVTHVIVDEVHERQQQTDVLLIALRELLQSTRPDLKVILMSATLDSKLFCSFFGNAPLVSVPGRTFPVSNYHLEDLMDATDHMIEEGSRYARRGYNTPVDNATLWVTNKGGDKRREVVDLVSQTDVQDVSDMYPGYKMATRRSMDRVNEEVINYDLLEDALNLILCRPDQNSTLLPPEGADLSTGSVLVFLPGMGEIRSVTERLEGNRNFRDKNRFQILPIHSTLSSQDQRRAFLPAKVGCRKIILSTNIAETSVTIPDVVCVIDTGRVREVRRNKRTSTSILVTDWCSKASSKQRAGRAGRVQPGICLKLYSSYTSQIVMKSASEPELRRVPLEEVCLNILASGFAKSSMDFLSKAPQPPDETSVKAAVTVLEEVGAIEVEEPASSRSKRIERLTPLGRHLAKLPVDVRLGKMLIFGALFRCLDKVLTIAASLSSQSPFATFVADANVAKAKQRAFADPDSDFVTYCNLWEAYSDAATKSTSAGRKFCQANYLSSNALREIGDARRQFLDLLCSIGFVERKTIGGGKGRNSGRLDVRTTIYDEHSGNLDLVHAVICAGLYPNVAQLTPGTGSSDCSLYYKTERLYFHNSSVNSRKKRYSDGWVVFHEKFGTPNRVSVATTCFVHPFALLLLGGSVVVKHTERIVIVDGWIEISLAAQIGVIMKELRKQVNSLLVKMVENAASTETEAMGANMVQGIVNLLTT